MIDTIAEHRATAKGNLPEQHVWWGWWKKGSEEDKVDALAAFHEHLKLVGPVTIGLLDRVLEPDESHSRLFIARCHEVSWSPAGQQDGSPNSGWTPSYYNDEEHPAWFLLSSLTSVSRTQWDAHFSGAGIVLGNSTLYWVEDGKPGQQFPPAPQIREHKVKHSAILHISDLHFGESHNFDSNGATPSQDMVASILAALTKLHLPTQFGALVVSGDLTTGGALPPLHHDAPTAIIKLLDELGMNKHHQLVVVPGNHDIQLEQGNKRYAQEDDYKDFLYKLFGRQVGDDLEIGRRLECGDGWTVTFMGFNSVKPRNFEFKDYGYVGEDRVETLTRELIGADQQTKSLVVAVLHHHLHPVERFVPPNKDRKASLTLDAGELIEHFQEHGVDIVLHGHQHIPFIGRAERSRRANGKLKGHQDGPLWVLGAGSAGSNVLPPQGSNSFSVYCPTEAGLHIRVIEFGPHVTPTLVLDDVLPLRRLAKASALDGAMASH